VVTPTTTTTTATTTTANVTAASTTSVSNVPGYTNSGNYGPGKTAAYIIAPFAVVAGTYFLAGHHQIEIHPNAGFFWPPAVNNNLHLRDEGMYGLKATAFINDNIGVEGNFSYINHL